ncbi:putative membrane protein [Wickerhamomyces ciferrii]|uniref:Cation-transporting ATPase n=1 Tax=Wickerhamomyces ciferrii (strain ATCC 14091 / BCRC 22168 / CBS 111 / JCM 3599 / NBRC 0793 / NRRL Y-1031 F-60-10) TaxID=1206466 RepID=K0KGL0_WICCF|nr:uncharacterized protein BN7_3842 [Wickerhamomyces ciferrii]CCH44280.1 putative membrane protein [Wickerhamomyces ciferrii]
MFDGAASEIIPSSITSFHHSHGFASNHRKSLDENSSIVSSRASSIRRGRVNNENHSLNRWKSSSSKSISYSRSRSQSIDSRSQFRFFNPEDIELAHGASTLDDPEDPIDYDTNWNSTPNYEHSTLDDDDFRRTSFSTQGSIPDYGSTMDESQHTRTSSSPSAYSANTFRDRIPSDVSSRPLLESDNESNQDDDSALDPTSSNVTHNHQQNLPHLNNYKELDAELHNHYYPDYPTNLHFQRFYIAEEDLVLGIAGYKTSKPRLFLYYLLCVCSFGLIYLLLRWLPKYKFSIYGEKVPLGKSEWVVTETEHGELNIIDVSRQWYNRSLSTVINVPNLSVDTDDIRNEEINNNLNPNLPILISFEYRYLNFYYSPVEDIFKTNTNWIDYNWIHINKIKDGLDKSSYEDRYLVFKENSLNLKEKTNMELLIDEVLHPFYIFQIFSIILWGFDEYYYYAGCIFLISIFSIINTLVETKSTMTRLQNLSKFECKVRVWRNDFWKEIDASDLVPGDIYEISDPSLVNFPCDSVLLSGDCIVNESMLTGESVPVSKLPATRETLDVLIKDSLKTQISPFLAKSYLFNGTKIIRVRHPYGDPAMALVVRTGFSTTKGALLRSMLFPKPVGFKFYEDSFKYIGFMTMIACIGFIFSTINFIKLGLGPRIIILRALDIITIVVPPALPATLTIGTSFALARLKLKNIFCISPTRVNVGGKLDILCFDKTGTLTEDGLDVYGVHVNNEHFNELLTNINQISHEHSKLLENLVSCHSLRVVDNELIGDPLDFKMFEFTGWKYEEEFKGFTSTTEERFDDAQLPENMGITPSVVYPENDPQQLLGILRSFEFVSQLRRMSVIIKKNQDFSILTKGAPEVIKDICNPKTFPENYEDLLYHYTHNGYRVIACAGKPLPKNNWLYSQKITREEAESNLEFLGFIVFENRLKPSTTGVLNELSQANLRTVMCTGDNLLTAVSVGRECGIVKEDLCFIPVFNEDDGLIWREIDDEDLSLDSKTLDLYGSNKSFSLAISGDVFRYLLKNELGLFSDEYIIKILLKANIFARMSPDEKHELVEQLQKLDYTVGFCGDGANDCGALKAADVGISLSEAEASVAAPFTSRLFEISCVLDVIKEGRASLVTSFSCFQYMSLYSAIQFISITILYKRGSNLGDFQFLWIDLFLILPIAIFMSWSNSYHKVDPKRPSANLVSPKLLIPLVVNILILLTFQLIIWLYVQTQTWYVKPIPGGDDAVQSSDNTVLFFYSNFQYILCAITLTVGPPYREPASKNLPFIANIVIASILSMLLMNVNVDGWLGQLFQLTEISIGFKWLIIIFALLNYLANQYIPPLFKKIWKKRESHKQYKRIFKNHKVIV